MGLGADSLVQEFEGFGHGAGAVIEQFCQMILQAASGAAPGPVGLFFG